MSQRPGHSTQETRAKISAAMKAKWADPEFSARNTTACRRATRNGGPEWPAIDREAVRRFKDLRFGAHGAQTLSPTSSEAPSEAARQGGGGVGSA